MSTPDPIPPQLPEDPITPPASGGFFSSPTTPYPAPSETDRSWAIGLHASPLIGLIVPFGNLLAPFIIWLIKKPESPYLDEAGKEVVNFQLTFTIYALICTAIAFITCGIGTILFLPLILVWLIFVIIAVIKTSNGEHYRYPATWRLIK
jgi:uncharacterized Tic20 family protein